MKLIVLIVLLSFIRSPAVAQVVDYQQEKYLVELLLEDTAALDSLVSSMMQHAYLLNATEAERSQKQEVVKQEKRSWLSTFTVGISLFSQSTVYDSQNESSVTTAGVLPNLGVSLSINPEKLANMPSNIRIARHDVTRIENTIKEQRRNLKIFITGKYYEYLEALNILELRMNTHERQRQQIEQVRLQFERGEAALGAVLLAQNGFADAEEALMRSQMLVLKLKNEITLFTTDSA